MAIQRQYLSPDVCPESPDEMNERLRSEDIVPDGESPATDSQDALSLASRLAEQDIMSESVWEWSLETRHDERYKKMGGRWGAVLSRNEVRCEAYNDSLPMAICCAVLLAVSR